MWFPSRQRGHIASSTNSISTPQVEFAPQRMEFSHFLSLTGKVALEQINAYCQMLDLQIRERDDGGILKY